MLQNEGRTSYHHLAPLCLLSNRAAENLIQSAPRERLAAGAVLFSSYETDAPRYLDGLAIVTQGRLDVHMYRGNDAKNSVVGQQSDLSAPAPHPSTPAPPPALAPALVASIKRDQSFGDQMLGLCHSSLSTSRALGPKSKLDAGYRVLVSEQQTEVMWISREMYEQNLREDRLRYAYVPRPSLDPATSAVSQVPQWEITSPWSRQKNCYASNGSDRGPRELSLLSRQLLADTHLCKFFFQLPPLVLERLCQCIEVRQYHTSSYCVIAAGDPIQCAMVVARGRIDIGRNLLESAKPTSTAVPIESLLPGDVFGGSQLRGSDHPTAPCEIVTGANTTVICIPQMTFMRWLAPADTELVFSPGSMLSQLFTAASPSKIGQRSDMRKFSATIGRRPMASGSQTLLPQPTIQHLDELGVLINRLGLLTALPRFLVSQLLPFVTLVFKKAGDILVQEMEEKAVLIGVVSGFVAVYSREHMTAAVEMLHNHSFCSFDAFAGSHTNPDDYVATMTIDEEDATAATGHQKGTTASTTHHRTAVHGLHIQTLAPKSSFRTGVLQDGHQSPATVVAQTDCECLVLDQQLYNHILNYHAPAIDWTGHVAASADQPAKPLRSNAKPVVESASDARGSIPSCPGFSNCVMESDIPWLPLSIPKKRLVLRHMRHVLLSPGQRLIGYGEMVNQLVVVVAGKLSVHVHQNQDVSSMLHASQQSMTSLMLERNVTSNYSTTSQQLYNQDDDNSSQATTRRGSKRASAVGIRDQLSRITGDRRPFNNSGIFVDSVLAAVQQDKWRRTSTQPSHLLRSGTENAIGVAHSRPNGGKAVATLLHAAVHRESVHRKLSIHRDDRRVSRFIESPGHRTLFLCHLGVGDVYGEDVLRLLVPSSTSVHDIYADCSSPGSDAGTGAASSGRVEVLCLDRDVYLSILSKTDEAAESEMRVRSNLVRSKWKRVGKDASRAKSETPQDRDSRAAQTATPRLLTLFQNLVNQRFHFTSRAIAAIPLLRELPDAARREICLVAKFETLERKAELGTGYKDRDGSVKPDLPFYIVLSGRVALVGKSANTHAIGAGHLSFSAAGQSSGTSDQQWLRDVPVGDGFGEFDIFLPEAPRRVHAVAVEPAKLLSIPAQMFEKYWPRATEMRENVKYLRFEVPFFSGLALDRLAYLYQSVTFQTYIRGDSKYLTALHYASSRFSKSCVVIAVFTISHFRPERRRLPWIER